MNFFMLVGLVGMSFILLYLAIRLGSAAFYRSKKEFEVWLRKVREEK